MTSLERLWEICGELREDPEIARWTDEALSDAARSRRHRTRRRFAAAGGLLAVMAAVVAYGWWLRPAEHRTARGEQRLVRLDDGSRVRLNTATRVRLHRGGDRVELVSGEAFFAVRPRESRTFEVDAGRTIRVLGTRFNVRRERGCLSVVVQEGRVAIRDREGAASSARVLRAGGVARYPARCDGVAPVSDATELARVEGWLAGRVEFDGAPLEEVARELSRYTPRPLHVAAPQLADLRLSGVFHVDRLDDERSLRFALENSLPVRLARRQGVLQILPDD